MSTNKNRTVSFSFDTLNEKNAFTAYAEGRGQTLAQFAKYACFQYRERYPGIARKRPKEAFPQKISTEATE
jgi:hypothetical protein